jgi:hypothetical protein
MNAFLTHSEVKELVAYARNDTRPCDGWIAVLAYFHQSLVSSL